MYGPFAHTYTERYTLYMFNPFPTLLSFSFFAPLILRVVAGSIFLKDGITYATQQPKTHKTYSALHGLSGIVHTLGGIMLILGFYTQIAGLILGITTLLRGVFSYRDSERTRKQSSYYFLLSAICFSLMLSGAGAFAIDLPL